MTLTRTFLAALVPLAAGLSASLEHDCAPHAEVAVRVRLPVDVAADAITLEPAASVRSSRLWRSSTLTVLADAASSRLTLTAPGLCPTEIPLTPGAPEASARPTIDVGGDRGQVGFDAPFEIVVKPGCSDAEAGEVTWRQIEGRPLRDLTIDERGFRLRARTEPLEELHPGPLPWGIVPMSPRTQGRTVLEATWTGSGHAVHRTVTVTAHARASGVPVLAIGTRVLLGGAGWHVVHAPLHGRAQVTTTAGGAEFEPDANGRWALEDAAGRGLGIRAGRFDTVPLDCGRADCHASEAAADNPMKRAFQRFFGEGGFPAGLGCALDCHVVGERGLADGGFLDVAKALPFRVDGSSWEELPRSLRRLGGVTCTGCHGPAMIPEPSARSFVLSADVCAVCHDAPPQYVHVDQWRASRMARSADPPAVRANPACGRCHTTAGFLSAIGVRKLDAVADPTSVVGVACAACHAPHGAHTGDAVLRDVTATRTGSVAFGEAFSARHRVSALCVTCHSPATPGAGEALPSASAATLWIGRAELPGGGAPLTGPAPHEAIDGGCVGCHGGTRPTDHSFRVDAKRCAPCHATARVESRDAQGRNVQDRARALWEKLAAPGPAATPHATAEAAGPSSDGPRARALYDVALVLEDPAAAVHNAPFARRLLDDAERALQGGR